MLSTYLAILLVNAYFRRGRVLVVVHERETTEK